MKTAFKDINDSKKNNYYSFFMDKKTYYLASRCINIRDDNVAFCIYYVPIRKVSLLTRYESFNGGGASSQSIFPIVTLQGELITGNSENGYKVEI